MAAKTYHWRNSEDISVNKMTTLCQNFLPSSLNRKLLDQRDPL